MKTRLLSLLLSLCLCGGILASCKKPEETDTTQKPTTEQTEEDPTDESGSLESDSNESESGTESDGTEVTVTPPVLEGTYGPQISTSNALSNGVNVYYPSADRKNIVAENKQMTLNYLADAAGKKQVVSLKNTEGKSYLENTMDVFVKLKGNDKVYYASDSKNPASMNLYRFGYYYYELMIDGQDFTSEYTVEDQVSLSSLKADTILEMSEKAAGNGSYAYTVTNTRDPQIRYQKSFTPVDASKYNYVAFTVKIDSKDMSSLSSATLFIIAGSASTFTDSQKVSSQFIADGEYHTYYLRMDNMKDYTGQLKGLRFDLDGNVGDTYTVKDISIVKLDNGGAPALGVNRIFNTYSDKLVHTVQLTATANQSDIEEIGMVTALEADKVAKLIIKDKNGTHSSLEGVDFDSAEYVAFDIKDVGIFGYILLADETSGKLTVTLENGKYVISQSRAPENGTLTVPTKETLHTGDFYMGQRLYTDESHSFDAFLEAAYCERNPLPAANITVDTKGSDEGAYIGYNALRGTYEFKVATSGFNIAYYEKQNYQPTLHFTVKGDGYDRVIYIQTVSGAGQIECAALLDKDQLLLPVPIEVCKNFSDGDSSIHWIEDITYSNVFLPLSVSAKSEAEYSLVHLYQNWGRFPLKQISSIQFHCPYYHLSTGVTETNCIVPWYTTKGTRNIYSVLPDHRAMSAPFWLREPQHTSGGDHGFLEYTDAEGNYSASENVKNTITSYGPTYAEIVMDYISDDGRIKASYTHMEMPQTDENRTYYTMTYEVLEDIEIGEFREDFFFYTMVPKPGMKYERIGYLAEGNVVKHRDVNPKDSARTYVLGDKCPYFTLYKDSDNSAKDGYVNISFLVASSEFIIGGKKCDANFVMSEANNIVKLSLDLEKVTLKAGDKFSINAIIMPWGSQESDYTLEDKNVTDVRENSLLNPYKIQAVESCTAESTVFLPTVKSTDGQNAVFTLSGGADNCTVKIQGLNRLAKPAVYELIEGKWVRYNLSSDYYPDKSGYHNAYDGYGIQYENGFFTYSFVVDMGNNVFDKDGKQVETAGLSRTFKLTVDEKQYTPEEKPQDDDKPVEKVEVIEGYNYYYGPGQILDKLAASRGYGKKELSADKSYISIYGDGTSADPQVYIHSLANETDPQHTGRYLVLKYRMPAENQKQHWFAVFTSTESPSASADSDFSISTVVQDGEWHVVVIDCATLLGNTYVTKEDGGYYAQHARFDFFNTVTDTNDRIDLAYVAYDDEFDSILASNKDVESVLFYNGLEYTIPTEGGKLPVVYEDDTSENTTPFSLYYSAKKLAYLAQNKGGNIGNITLSEDGKSMSVSSKAGAAESYIYLLKDNSGSPAETGRYAVIKYRATGLDTNYLQLYASTVNLAPKPEDGVDLTGKNGCYSSDDAWKIVILDLAKINTTGFTASEDGKYRAISLRFDIFNNTYETDDKVIELGFAGFCDDLKAAATFDQSVDTVTFFDGTEATSLSTATGE